MSGDLAEKRDSFPPGLSTRHIEPRGPLRRHASPFPILLLGAIVLAAMLGLFGGTPYAHRTVESEAAGLTVIAPETLRDGMFFEMRFEVLAKSDIAEPVLAVEPSLWRDVTINTFIPAPSEEEYKDGMFRFTFPALEAGDRMTVKVDGQINPSLVASTHGEIAIFDGERRLVGTPYALKVYP
jgi:hypothetical protein